MSSEKVLDYAGTALKFLSDDDSLWLGWNWYSVGMAEISKGNIKQGAAALQSSLEYSKKSNNLYLISEIAYEIAYHEMRHGHYKASYKHCSDLLKYMKVCGYSEIAKAEWTYTGLITMMSVIQCIWTDLDSAYENVKTAYNLSKNEKNIAQRIKVLLADDHTVVREGLRALLMAEPDMEIVGEAENGRQAIQLTKQHLPDVVVMDIAMPVLNGIESTRQITRGAPGCKVLILSSYSDDEYVRQVTEAGAVGYLVKQTAASELLKAIREVSQGNVFFSPAIAKRLRDQYREGLSGGQTLKKRADHLTAREVEVLQLIAEGLANKQIAAELCISIKTVEKHRQQVMNKLGIHDVAGLTRHAMAKGIIENSSVLKPL
jgi:DNA-binding NarL/FixJ family response regulator